MRSLEDPICLVEGKRRGVWVEGGVAWCADGGERWDVNLYNGGMTSRFV